MSDNTGETTGDVDAQNEGAENIREIDLLKSRAGMMGINFSNNIGIEALKAKIEKKLAGNQEEGQEEDLDEIETPDLDTTQVNALEIGANGNEPLPERPKTLREWVHDENMKLVRVRITNLDPKKKDLPGEIITVANEYLGTVRKFVPYGEHTEDGYHLPWCIYEMLRNRKFLNIRTVRDRRTGTQTVNTSWVPEFSLEVLDPLTKTEIAQLAQAQIAAGSVESNAA